MVMTILPGLTTTVQDEIPRFVADLAESDVRTIAFFPTAIDPPARVDLYRELERIDGLRLPHVHLRTDCDVSEIDYLVGRFSAEVFNVHPAESRHPFGDIPPRLVGRFFMENVEVVVSDDDFKRVAGICPDFSHLEAARLMGRTDYYDTTMRQLSTRVVGCCHVSAIRPGDPNEWNGGPDHHRFVSLANLDYLVRYRRYLPHRWVSLELENPLSEQIDAIAYLSRKLGYQESTLPPYVSPAPNPTVRTV